GIGLAWLRAAAVRLLCVITAFQSCADRCGRRIGASQLAVLSTQSDVSRASGTVVNDFTAMVQAPIRHRFQLGQPGALRGGAAVESTSSARRAGVAMRASRGSKAGEAPAGGNDIRRSTGQVGSEYNPFRKTLPRISYF